MVMEIYWYIVPLVLILGIGYSYCRGYIWGKLAILMCCLAFVNLLYFLLLIYDSCFSGMQMSFILIEHTGFIILTLAWLILGVLMLKLQKKAGAYMEMVYLAVNTTLIMVWNIIMLGIS